MKTISMAYRETPDIKQRASIVLSASWYTCDLLAVLP